MSLYTQGMTGKSNHTSSIEIENLTKRFGDLIAVNDLSLKINKGEILGLLGPNGAGKSTTINIICGLMKPDNGHVHLEGKEMDKTRKSLMNIGLCPQEIICWPKLTCLEQLIFIGNLYGMADSTAKLIGLKLLDRLGLNEKRNKLAQTLSGGMKRRLNLALALIHDPRILILDEPEAGLDPQSRVMVREFIKEMSENKTVILSSHNMDEVDRLADWVAIIDHGKLLVSDTPEKLKKSIGEGDILEIDIMNSDISNDEFLSVFNKLVTEIQLVDKSLVIRSKNAAELIPEICSLLQENKISYSNIRLRGNTLEDVFIQLTGRRLRE